MKTKFTFISIVFLTLFYNSYGTIYNWTGSVDSSFTNSGNWSNVLSSATYPGYPVSGDIAIIGSATKHPVLTSNHDIEKLVISLGTLDLNGYELTLTGSGSFVGALVENGTLVIRGTEVSFTGAMLDVTLDVNCDRIILNSSTFNDSCIFTTTGLEDSNSDGGCIFNGTVTIVHTGSNKKTFRMAMNYGDEFNSNVIFTNNSDGMLSIAEADSTWFNGNVEVNNSGGQAIIFGYRDGVSLLASGKTISIGSDGYSVNELVLINFKQQGSTAQTIALTEMAVLQLHGCEYNGSVTIAAPEILVSNSTFNALAQITKTGSGRNYWHGNNVFNGTTTIINEGDGDSGDEMRLAERASSLYNSDVSIQSSGKPIQVVRGSGSEFRGNVFFNDRSITFNTGLALFTGNNNQQLTGTEAYLFTAITIDKSMGHVTLQSPASVSNGVTFTQGHLVTDSTNIITFLAGSEANGAHNGSFVSGPVKKVGDTEFEFPVGKGNQYSPLGISAPDSITDAFMAEFKQSETLVNTGDRDTTIGKIFRNNYWDLFRLNGTSQTKITLSWNQELQLTDTLIDVVGWNGSLWKDMGAGVIYGDSSAGSVKSDITASYYYQFAISARAGNAFYVTNNCNDIQNALQLHNCLVHANAGSVLQVTTHISVPNVGLGVPFPLTVLNGVTLQGNNGSSSPHWWEPGCPQVSTDLKAEYDVNNKQKMFLFGIEPGGIIQNLRLRGASCNFQDYNGDDYLCGGIITINDASPYPVEINYCEISCFSYAGVFKMPRTHLLSSNNNYIHHVKGNGKSVGIGYGVWTQAHPTIFTQAAFSNTIFDDNKAAIDGQGYPMNWDIDKCSFTSFFQSEEINKHNDNRFKIYDPDDNVPFDYHFCYDNNSCGSNCYYGIHCPTFLPCSTTTCTSGYVTNFIGCTTGTPFPIYDVGGAQTDITDCIFHKSWKIGSKQSNISLNFPNRDTDPLLGGNASNGITILNNTFVTVHDDPSAILSYDNRGGYARIADNYIEACVWDGDGYIDYTSPDNFFNYKIGKSTSAAPQPSEVQLELFDASNNVLPFSYNKSITPGHERVQYLDVNTSFKISTNPGSLGGQALTYIIRSHPNDNNPFSPPLISSDNYFYDDEIIADNNLTSLPGYDKPGLYGIDVLAFDATGSPSYNFKASNWQHVPIIVKPSDNKKLYFNIKDSYYDFPGSTYSTNVFKQVEINGAPIWREDIADGGNGWEYVEVDLDGDILGTSNKILTAVNTNGEPNVLSFSIVIDGSTTVSVDDLRGLLVWVDDVYIKKYDSPTGDNLIFDGSVELSTGNISTTPSETCFWYYQNAFTFTGCDILRLISGANGEDEAGDFNYYADGSRVAITDDPKSNVSLGSSDRRSGKQALILKLPGLKTCSSYNNNNGDPLISGCINFDFTDFLSCDDYDDLSFVAINPSAISTVDDSYTDQKLIIDDDIIIPAGRTMTFTGCQIVVRPHTPPYKITVQSGGTLKIFPDIANQIKTHIFACGDMWGGIVSENGNIDLFGGGTSYTVYSLPTTIEDAVTAFDSNGGTFEMRYVIFDHNYNAIHLHHSAHSFSGAPFIKGCTFKTTDRVISKSPYAGLIPYQHLRLDNISELTFHIGDTPSGLKNTFSDAYSGIYASNSNVEILNNDFTNLYTQNTQLPASRNFGRAIFIYNDQNGSNLTATIGEAGKENNFSKVNIGVQVLNSCTSCDINIQNNNFDNSDYGDLGAGTGFYNTAITIQSPTPAMAGPTMVKNNTITNHRIGIHAINIPNIEVGGWDGSNSLGNTINYDLSQFPLTLFHEGIWLQSCTGAKVVKNEVSNTTFNTDSKFRGIDIESSPDCDINCSTIEKTGIALNFYANCNQTQVRENVFNNYGTGIMLNGPNGASINADQGGLDDAWDNQWYPLIGSSSWKVDGMVLGINNFINWYHQDIDDPDPIYFYSPNPWNGNIINPKANEDSGNITCDDFFRYAVSRVANFGSIVGDSANYSTDSIATRYQARLETYLAMKNDTTIIYHFDSLDSHFENFYLTLDSGNVGRFNRIVEIAVIDSDSAAYLNAQINPVGETESLLKSFNELYFDKILSGDTLSSADSTDLEYLTQLSRSAYGAMVHNAAAALFYEVHPEETPSRFEAVEYQNQNVPDVPNANHKVIIYPNPAREMITLVSTLEMRVIELFNSYGSLLIKENLNEKIIEVELNNLPSGVYYVKTTLYSGDIVVTKFILQK